MLQTNPRKCDITIDKSVKNRTGNLGSSSKTRVFFQSNFVNVKPQFAYNKNPGFHLKPRVKKQEPEFCSKPRFLLFNTKTRVLVSKTWVLDKNLGFHNQKPGFWTRT